MANPYLAVIRNICAGKSTFVTRFSASHREWYGLPEVLSETQRSSLPGPDPFYLYASFFADFYIERHRLAQQIPGPLIQESCLESSSLSEGPNIGLIGRLASFARVNEYGH